MSKPARDQIVNALISIIGTLFVLFGTGAWSSKESTSDHRNDIQILTAIVQRTLDAVCYDKPTARPCVSPSPVPK